MEFMSVLSFNKVLLSTNLANFCQTVHCVCFVGLWVQTETFAKNSAIFRKPWSLKYFISMRKPNIPLPYPVLSKNFSSSVIVQVSIVKRNIQRYTNSACKNSGLYNFVQHRYNQQNIVLLPVNLLNFIVLQLIWRVYYTCLISAITGTMP